MILIVVAEVVVVVGVGSGGGGRGGGGVKSRAEMVEALGGNDMAKTHASGPKTTTSGIEVASDATSSTETVRHPASEWERISE